MILPSTAWLEELGCKMTNTHLYLMERALRPAGDARTLHEVLNGMAERLGVNDFYPWGSQQGPNYLTIARACARADPVSGASPTRRRCLCVAASDPRRTL